MGENRRERYSGGAPLQQKRNNDFKISVKFDITELDLICAYIVSDNKTIRRSNVINLRNLFSIIDMNAYVNDQDRLMRIDFINKGIEARLDNNLTSTNMILNHIAGGFGNPTMYGQFKQLNNDEVAWVNNTTSEILKYSIIYNDVDEGLSLLTRFKSTDYADRGPIVKDIEQWIKDMQIKFRKSRSDNQDDLTFSLDGNQYIEAMTETHKQLSSPSNRLKFGTQALNALTGGGVEAGRVYTLLGLPGEGKSSTLIDMAIQIKRYNRDYQCTDPTKRPAVVLLVMENGIKETVQRIFSMCVGTDMLQYDENEICEVLRTQGNLHLSGDDPIDLIVKFKPNLSVDTSYLYTMTEDLEDEGYEVICVLQDYLKRIKSTNNQYNQELRLQLGAVVNEFKVFATEKNIPVITASQLNRVATNSIDEARVKNKADLVRLIGRGNVGESNLILENSDWIALIAPEYDKDKQKYLGIQRVKSRYYIAGDFYCAYLPYINGTIKFVEDYYSPIPVHKVSMREPIELNGMNNGQGVVNQVTEFAQFNEVKLPTDTAGNMFLNANAIAAVNLENRYEGLFGVRIKWPEKQLPTKQRKDMCKIVSR